jgi:DNA-binding MarR family transcriptional regulator
MAEEPIAEKSSLDRNAAMARAMTLIGIIDQLFTTRATSILKSTGLPYPRFGLLHHFGFNPSRGWTIGELATVMEMNQPAITKLVQRLIDQGYLETRPDDSDRRIKRCFITQAGLSARQAAINALGPDVITAFADWKTSEITDMVAPLERLKTWLDDHRRG